MKVTDREKMDSMTNDAGADPGAWPPSSMLVAELPSPGVAGINQHSLVVGSGRPTRASTCRHPWVWSPEWATPELLPTLTGLHPEADCHGGLSTIVANVNDQGDIAGQATAADGSLRVVRSTPIEQGRVK